MGFCDYLLCKLIVRLSPWHVTMAVSSLPSSSIPNPIPEQGIPHISGYWWWEGQVRPCVEQRQVIMKNPDLVRVSQEVGLEVEVCAFEEC